MRTLSPRGARLAWLSALLAAMGTASAAPASHFADADDHAAVAEGRPLYIEYCAACHGKRLEGQALWQLQDKDSRRRAPAHDATGHTWQHSDEALFHMIKDGRFPGTPADSVSYMPEFGSDLSDADILRVMAFIKAQWPIGLRASQSMLNPAFAGMPADAATTDWKLPPSCSATQRWRAESR